MSFAPQTGFLKSDFVMSTMLAILGCIVLGTMSRNSYRKLGPEDSVCLLLGDPQTYTFHSSACVFTIFVGFLIAAGGVGLFAMDYVTWKRSERFKGKRASAAALLISPIMCFFSFSTAVVIGTGISKFCSRFTPSPDQCDSIKQLSGLRAGVGAATVAGFLFAFYGFSEYAQYRRRHINGDKW